MGELVLFRFENQQVRTITRAGDPWFVAKDVCEVLEIGNVPDACGRLDDDEKDTIVSTDSVGRPHQQLIVSESGLYTLVLGSRKPEARAFKRWITHEVIPQIRRTGMYAAPSSIEDLIIMQAQSVKDLKAQIETLTERTTTALHRIDTLDTVNIEGDLRQRFDKMIRLYARKAGLVYSLAWRHFDQAWNTAYHSNLTALRENYAKRNGIREVTRPEYLFQTDHIEDALRIADKLLDSLPHNANERAATVDAVTAHG
jgi:prophage antirepressor-like protein